MIEHAPSGVAPAETIVPRQPSPDVIQLRHVERSEASERRSDLPHRLDIDGLRAVAVLLVLLYHAGLGCPGGFVGVDVFFVISGFLIAGVILRDLEAGTFSLSGFWLRRVRRIAPAAACLTAVVLLAGEALLRNYLNTAMRP